MNTMRCVERLDILCLEISNPQFVTDSGDQSAMLELYLHSMWMLNVTSELETYTISFGFSSS